MSRDVRKGSLRALHTSANRRLGELFAQRRDVLDLSQEDVADKLGWHQSSISKIENSRRRADVFEVILIARVLKMNPRALLAAAELFLREEDLMN